MGKILGSLGAYNPRSCRTQARRKRHLLLLILMPKSKCANTGGLFSAPIPKTTAPGGGSLSNSVPDTGQIRPLVTLASLLTLNFSSQESEDQQSLCSISPVLPSQPGPPPQPCTYLPNSRGLLSAPSVPKWNICCFCCSVAQSCSTLFDPVDCNMPGFPVLHCLLKFAQIHVHRISDTI